MGSRPEAARALLRAGSNPSREDAEAFFATRVADYARAIAIFFGGLYAAGIVFVLALSRERFWAIHTHPAKVAHLVVPVACGLAAYALRRPARPPWLASVVDAVVPIGTSVVVAALSRTAPAGYGLFLLPLLVAALLLVLRAALVPSPPLRTALVGLAASGPTVWACYTFAALEPTLPQPLTATLVAVGSAAWCLALCGATALVSQTIYGLHRDIAAARRMGQYVLGDLIGEGGMGAVYHAEHALLRRQTAVKILLPDRAGPDSIARFEREVQLTARLTHPNTVSIYDYGRTADGGFYYAMEYLDGLTLEDLVRRFGAQPPGRVARILRQLAGALGEAHAHGLVHRDVKPANIILCERGGIPDLVKLLDFGLVKDVGPMPSSPALTVADGITGTPQFLAPEGILEPGSIDHRIDIYALGCVGYFLVTGRQVFQGNNTLEVCAQHLNSTPVPPSERLGRKVPPGLESLILQCLAKSPDARPDSVGRVHQALRGKEEQYGWSEDAAREWWKSLRTCGGPDRTASPTDRRTA
jgi:serine/threonine-protein kinase